MDIKITISDVNKLHIACEGPDNVSYAYYLYRNDEVYVKFPYADKKELDYWLSESGTYYVKAFCKTEEDQKTTKDSAPVVFDEEEAFGLEKTVLDEKPFLRKMWDVILEIFGNWEIVVRMADFDYRLENKDTYLGKIWSVFTPLIQVGTYWLVFGIGIRNGNDVDGFPYLVWMLCGLIPWFFINGCIVHGANSIYQKAALVTRMKFPISTVPVSKILQESKGFVVSFVIMILILFSKGVYPSLYWLNLVYYYFYAMVFLISLAMVTSVLTMVARDIFKLLQSIIRLLFYLTPILWVMDNMPKFYQVLMEFNPIYYIVRGFRESILYQVNFYVHVEQMAIMWGFNLLFILLGCVLQAKFRNKFIDL